jgi:AraC family transcriptional regulator
MTDHAGLRAHSADAPAYWQHIDEGWEGELYARSTRRRTEILPGLPSGDGRLRYLCAVRVSSFDGVPEKYARYTVPAGEYAVFTTDPVDQTGGKNADLFAEKIASLWKAIFEEWFESGDWQFDPDAPDYEFYDERCHYTPNSVMEIHCPEKSA